jgi:hypothetical protein
MTKYKIEQTQTTPPKWKLSVRTGTIQNPVWTPVAVFTSEAAAVAHMQQLATPAPEELPPPRYYDQDGKRTKPPSV